jgi:hypothetical protein
VARQTQAAELHAERIEQALAVLAILNERQERIEQALAGAEQLLAGLAERVEAALAQFAAKPAAEPARKGK